MEGRQPSIEELLNTIQFFKKALEFYANETNYSEPVMVVYEGVGSEWSTKIKVDGGHQARFALEQSQDIEDYNKQLMVDYYDSMDIIQKQMDEPTTENIDSVKKSIEELKEKYKLFK